MFFSLTPGAKTTSGDHLHPLVQQWFGELSESVAFLESGWTSDTGRGLPRLPLGYRPLMRYVLGNHQVQDRVAPPLWLEKNRFGELPFSFAGARLLDGFVAHLAAQIQAEFGGPWELRTDSSASDVWPLQLGDRFSLTANLDFAVQVACGMRSPVAIEHQVQAISWARGIDHDPALYDGAPFGLHEDVLHAGPEAWATNVESVPAQWPTGEITLVTWAELMAREPEMPVHELVLRAFSEGPDGDEVLHPPDLTHTVEVFSHLEHEIGEDARASLEEILLNEPGVLETSGEDREWLYLKAPGMTDDEVLALVRRVVLRLRAEFKAANGK